MNRSTFDAMLAQYSKDESSGDGSVNWENGAHCIIPEVKIGGKVEQVQYTGKNLFDLERRTERTFANTGWSNTNIRDFDENSFYRGLTGNGYYDPSAVSNLSISLPNNVLSFDVAKSGYGIGISLRVTPGQTYIAHSEGNAQFAFGVYDESGVYLTWSGNATMNIITIPDGGFWMTVVVRGAIGAISAQNIQVELGSTATSYEPYTGGIPAPSPIYPIMPTFSKGTKVVSRGRNLADAFIASDQYQANTEKIAPNTFRVTRASPTWHGGYGQIKIEGLPKNRSVCVVASVRDRGDPIDDSTFARLYIWKESNASAGYYASILHLGDLGETTKRSEPFITPTGYFYCGMYPNLANDGDSAVYEIAVYLADDDTEACDPVYFDGGEAVAPELLTAFDGSCQSLWDPQTGRGLNWWYDMIELDGSETWTTYPSHRGFSCHSNCLPEAMLRNRFWSNFAVDKKGIPNITEMTIWCGVVNRVIYSTFNPFFDDTLPDSGIANWKAHLAEHHLKLWVARNEPIEFQTDPQPLVQPKGYGQLIQTDGTLDDCPITVTPVTHQ